MTVDALPSAKPLTTSQAVLFGTLVVGTLDILDAFIFNGSRSGVSPGRILQFIASGVLGRESFNGGAPPRPSVCCSTTSSLSGS